MAKKLPTLVRRQRALRKTQDRFAGRVFELGVTDCAILVRAHLKAMGHANVPAPGRYRTPVQAALALKAACEKVGADGVGLVPLLDALLERIPPAAMLPGDIGLGEREDGPEGIDAGALGISVGRKFWGWQEGEERRFVLIDPTDQPFSLAWRA